MCCYCLSLQAGLYLIKTLSDFEQQLEHLLSLQIMVVVMHDIRLLPQPYPAIVIAFPKCCIALTPMIKHRCPESTIATPIRWSKVRLADDIGHGIVFTTSSAPNLDYRLSAIAFLRSERPPAPEI